MGKDYMMVAGSRRRIEVNWLALAAFLKEVGRDTMDGLADFSQLRPSELPALIAAAANEGERLEGRECNLTAQEVGETMRPSDAGAFLNIYIAQSRPQVEEEPSKKKEVKR